MDLSSWTRDWINVSCSGRQILSHQTIRELFDTHFLSYNSQLIGVDLLGSWPQGRKSLIQFSKLESLRSVPGPLCIQKLCQLITKIWTYPQEYTAAASVLINIMVLCFWFISNLNKISFCMLIQSCKEMVFIFHQAFKNIMQLKLHCQRSLTLVIFNKSSGFPRYTIISSAKK